MNDFTKMSDFTTENLMMEREGVFNEEKTKRFELTFVCSGMETMETEMSILVIGLNPNSRDILTMETIVLNCFAAFCEYSSVSSICQQ